ncbi:MAG: single-stranded-DNA-specific exonuclease RecJ [Coriobacteriia bacterium]
MTLCESNEWAVYQADEARVRALQGELGISNVTATVLAARGLTTADQARAFLSPTLERDWPQTRAIPGLSDAAERVRRAIADGESIVIFGDFDLDGISSAALAALGIQELGGRVSATVPHRFKEGYGLTTAAIERLASMSPDVVVTVDCGISGAAEVGWLRERGIDVVVTDHHEPGAGVPAGVPVADPKLAKDGPELAGAGVALALVRAVGELLGRPDVWRELTDLATLGTVADVVPLTGPNRALVTDGLARMRTNPRLGIGALAAVAALPVGEISAERVAFALAPRLNAAGRMADPALSLELLMTSEPGRADELAHALDEHNRLRQAAEGDLMDAALEQVATTFTSGDRALVVAGEGWHEGVRGIVASRLVGRFGVPALVFCIEDGEAQGSGRSVPGVDLFEALTALEPMLDRYGGHAAAVGLALPAAQLEAFTRALCDQLATLEQRAFVPALSVDAVLQLDQISLELVAELAALEPFGFGNPRPMLASRGVFLNGRKAVGKTGEHFAFAAYDGVASVPGIMFRCAGIEELVSYESTADIAFEIDADVWQGNRRIRMLARDISTRKAPGSAPASSLVDDLFEHADEIIARGEYAGIGEAEAFHTKLAGVTFEGRQELIARLQPGTPLRLVRQPDNEFDPAACALHDPRGAQVGFFNRRLAAVLAPYVDAGVEYDVSVTEVTGGDGEGSLGVNVLVRRQDYLEEDAEAEEAALARRVALRALEPAALDSALVAHFLGDRPLHRAQSEALDSLATGVSTLVVMATGRGKSLIFHLHAARQAIASDRASVFVYPLRALVADQAFHLRDAFAEIGCRVRTVTGETAPGERDEAFSALSDGILDVVLTTPEFLDHHAGRFAASGRVGFVVVDEAHHVGLSKAGHRPAYGRLGRALDTLGAPTVLAVTATASVAVEEEIRSVLHIERTVLDATVRENLRLEDRRGAGDKNALLASLAARGEKMIVYANSRDVTVRVARMLRERVPGLQHAVTFYNGGLTRSARHAVESAFRDGAIRVVVATSAFGEGVNIPDVRHVALYHLPFNAVEFNQMSGRAGRDGAPAHVHLLYTERDARINRSILQSLAPERDDLAALYLTLKESAAQSDGGIEITNSELADRLKKRRKTTVLDERGVSAALGVFRELGLIETEGGGSYRRLSLLPAPDAKLDLTTSVRYAEGLEELELFDEFREWALTAGPEELLHAFDRPILPRQPGTLDGGGEQQR